MKLQIIKNINDQLNGFTSITISQKDEIKNIIHSSCTEVFANRVLDELTYQEAIQFLVELMQRVRLGGNIILSGIDLISLGQNITNELIDSQSVSYIINNAKSIIDTRIITNLLESNGFVLEYLMLLDQNYYELKANRVK
jgi:hypothetical protein